MKQKGNQYLKKDCRRTKYLVSSIKYQIFGTSSLKETFGSSKAVSTSSYFI